MCFSPRRQKKKTRPLPALRGKNHQKGTDSARGFALPDGSWCVFAGGTSNLSNGLDFRPLIGCSPRELLRVCAPENASRVCDRSDPEKRIPAWRTVIGKQRSIYGGLFSLGTRNGGARACERPRVPLASPSPHHGDTSKCEATVVCMRCGGSTGGRMNEGKRKGERRSFRHSLSPGTWGTPKGLCYAKAGCCSSSSSTQIFLPLVFANQHLHNDCDGCFVAR